MRILLTGKGGSGKTTIAGTLARHLAGSGMAVVAVDADPSPNLGVALGLPPASVEVLVPLLNALLADGHIRGEPLGDPEALLARYGLVAPGPVTLVATGTIERPSETCLCCGTHSTARDFFAALSGQGRTVVVDLEPGLNDLLWLCPRPDDMVVVVAEPSAKSVEIARRARRLARSMGVSRIVTVANRCSGGDAARMADELGELASVIPEDAVVEEAGHLGIAPIDADDSSPAVGAMAELAALLMDDPVPG